MKLCTYKLQTPMGEIKRAAIYLDSKLFVDINYVWQLYFEKQGFFNSNQRADVFAPSSLSELIKRNENPLEKLQQTLSLYESLSKQGDLKTLRGHFISYHLNDYKNIDFDVPLDHFNSYRDFYIHEKHVKKGFEKRGEPVPESWYEMPVYYKGPTTNFLGNNDFILWPSYSKKLDYELELAVIIGRDGKNIKASHAHQHILGYTILNDISARDIQKKEMAVRLGPAKGKDFCSIVGPVITTADEFNFKEPDLLMSATINGQKWSEGRSSEGHYSWAQMIEHASKEEWLLATDLLGSGTVGTGCGLEIDKWIKPGDKVELEIESIGKLSNIVGTPH